MRKILAYILYYIGHIASKLCGLPAPEWFHDYVAWPLYQKFMIWSSNVQGPSDSGPWKSVKHD